MRAVLLASATAATFAGLRCKSVVTQARSGVGFVRLYRMMDMAPEISSRRMYLSPRLVMPLRTFLFPLAF